MVGDGNLRTLGTESFCVEEPNFVGAESFCAARLENLTNNSTQNCLGPLDPLPPYLPPYPYPYLGSATLPPCPCLFHLHFHFLASLTFFVLKTELLEA
jgi:hypothetical protein